MSTTFVHTHRTANGFRRCTIGELCSEDRTIVEPHSQEAAELPYLGLEHVEGGTGRILLTELVTREDAEQVGNSTTFRFGSQHVLYGKLRPYLNKVAVPTFSGRCTTELIPLKPRPGVARDFLAWTLRRPEVVEAAMRERTGARMPRADMEHVLGLTVIVPKTLDAQHVIADDLNARLEAVIRAKRACQEQLHLLDAYMRSLLRDQPTLDESSEQFAE